jgi:transposase
MASSRKLTVKLKRYFECINPRNKIDVSYVTVNNALNKVLSKPRKIRKVFYLNTQQRQKRLAFSNYILNNGITGNDIFFTDESIFNVCIPINKATNVIRLSKSSVKKLKRGDEEVISKVCREEKKYSEGFMVAAGLSAKGVGPMIFIAGKVNNFAYRQILDFYRDDMANIGGSLYFQQDGAKAHTSTASMAKINSEFPTRLDFWPPNSPDLSPIEQLLSLVKAKLLTTQFSTLAEMKARLFDIWNTIPVSLCKRLCGSFVKKIQLVKKYEGRRLDKELLRKLRRKHRRIKHRWEPYMAPDSNIERIAYNEVIIKKLIKKHIAKHRKRLVLTKRMFKRRIIAAKQLKKSYKFADLALLSHSRRLKVVNGPDRLIRERDEEITIIEEEILRLENIDEQEYINSLNENIKSKLINLRLSRDVLDDQSTHVDEEDVGSNQYSEIEEDNEVNNIESN